MPPLPAGLDFRRWDSGPSTLTRAGSWRSALSHGVTQRRVHPVVMCVLIFGGISVLGSAVAYLSGAF